MDLLKQYQQYVKSETDLIYIDEYRQADDDIQKQALLLYQENKDIKAVIDFCEKQKMFRVAEKLKKEANLSKRFTTRTFENFLIETPAQKNAYELALNYSQNIDKELEDGTGIIFVGQGCVGTGKTHLACAIANDLLNRGYPVKVINVAKMIYQIKEDFKVDEYINVPILLIDDLGKETGTQWVCEMLYLIFNERYEAMKPTIITTENGLDEIKRNYVTTVNGTTIDRGKSIISRLTEDFIYIPLTGDDFRQRRAA